MIEHQRGRLASADRSRFDDAMGVGSTTGPGQVRLASELVIELDRARSSGLDSVVVDLTRSRAAELVAYEDASLATIYLDHVVSVATRERDVAWALHPPVLRDRGLKHKIEIGTWAAPAMRLLARGLSPHRQLAAQRGDSPRRTDRSIE